MLHCPECNRKLEYDGAGSWPCERCGVLWSPTIRRKLVYWVNQNHYEAFELKHGVWHEADHEYWPLSSFRLVEIRASNEDFYSRKDGAVVL